MNQILQETLPFTPLQSGTPPLHVLIIKYSPNSRPNSQVLPHFISLIVRYSPTSRPDIQVLPYFTPLYSSTPPLHVLIIKYSPIHFLIVRYSQNSRLYIQVLPHFTSLYSTTPQLHFLIIKYSLFCEYFNTSLGPCQISKLDFELFKDLSILSLYISQFFSTQPSFSLPLESTLGSSLFILDPNIELLKIQMG